MDYNKITNLHLKIIKEDFVTFCLWLLQIVSIQADKVEHFVFNKTMFNGVNIISHSAKVINNKKVQHLLKINY